MENLSPETKSLLELNKIADEETAAGALVDHLFRSLKALRELNQCGVTNSHSELVLATLTTGASSLTREMVSSIEGREDMLCPAHGNMELIHFGSDRHAHLLDNVYKIRSQKKNISCRHCDRTSLTHDLKFFYCSTCHYTRCIYCVPSPVIPWKTVKALLEACPAVCEKVFAGGRLLLHEIVPREESIEVLQLYLSMYRTGVMISDSCGELPIHWAARCNETCMDVLELLATAYPESVRIENRDGKLPLHMAIQSRNMDAVRYLLQLHPDGSKTADVLGWYPIHYAVNCSPDPDPDLLDTCLAAYPEGCEKPNRQGLFPLHLYVRSRAAPSSWVIQKLLVLFPFAAFVTTGDQDELPLHVVAARSAPCPKCVEALINVNPEGALQMSKEMPWAEANSPLGIAEAAARRREKDGTVDGVPLEMYWEVVRIMLLPNRRHDQALLRECLYKVRRAALLISLRIYAAKYPTMSYSTSPTPSTSCPSFLSEDLPAVGKGADAFELLAELHGTSRHAWRMVIQYL